MLSIQKKFQRYCLITKPNTETEILLLQTFSSFNRNEIK